LKTIATINDETLPEETDPTQDLLYVDISRVDSSKGILHKEEVTFGAAPSRARRIVRSGDVIISTVRTYLRAIAAIRYAEENLIVSTGFAVIRPREQIDGTFVAYALRASYFVDRIVSESVGVSFPAINAGEIGCLPVVIPPKQEQHAIVKFLDGETAKTDALIALKERLLGCLQEKRSTLITRTVTEGLNPKVRKKYPKVEGLEEMPSHWGVRRLKNVVSAIEQGWSPLCENRQASESEWAVLKVGCVNGVEFDEAENKALPAGVQPRSEYEIHPGDILMSRANTRQLLASAALVKAVRPRLLLCDKLYRIRLRADVIAPAYLIYALASGISRFHFEREATGASGSMQNIAQEAIGNLALLIPPVEEQNRIVAFLDEQTEKLAELEGKVREGIERLEAFRNAIITSAVTGKIDIREEVP
jgi:type I restriction enzyme S subunit